MGEKCWALQQEFLESRLEFLRFCINSGRKSLACGKREIRLAHSHTAMMIKPLYSRLTRTPKALSSRANKMGLSSGEVSRYARLTPRAAPLWSRARKSGILEQEQKGVSAPSAMALR